MRTHNNGQLRLADVNSEVTLVGWVARRRDLGSMVFIDLRDRYGKTQLVFDDKHTDIIKNVRNEYVIQVKGKVAKRQESNPDLKTGEIEVLVESMEVINKAKTTPLIIAEETDALENVRLKYRYLDLRRPNMQNNLITRSKITNSIRRFLDDKDFVDIETPILGKSTPEGARDYLVPSRNYAGEFYALPQSPQLYKQLLMISGFERYYQIARCFRDEDLRADRQMEFTQVDLEMSFMSEEAIQALTEKLMQTVFKEVLDVNLSLPFKKLTWHDAMDLYGSDKPDTRFNLEFIELTDIFKNSEFKVLRSAVDSGGTVKGIVVNDYADISRREIDNIVDVIKANGGMGILDLKFIDGKLDGRILKFFSEEEIENLTEKLNLKENDLVLMASGDWEKTCTALGAVRLKVAKDRDLINEDKFNFLWVTDFPLLEYDEEDKRYYARHHPFTRPKDEDLDKLDSDPKSVKAYAYDMICNGYELGGGSLRNYSNEAQTKLFEVLGFSEAEIKDQFGFFVEAFDYGTPPHGGIAFGLDRLAMIMTGEKTIREVIAFPKTANARDQMMDAPSLAVKSQLDDLHLCVVSKDETKKSCK